MSRQWDRQALGGEVTVPGDKSISHRALIVAALAHGAARVTGLNGGRDVSATAACLGRLGVAVRVRPEKAEAEVESLGFAALEEPGDVLDAANSGTTLRCLAGVCAALDGASVLTGDDTLRARPMLRIVEPLRAMGARIDGREGGRFAPLFVRGGRLRGIAHRSPVPSAQVKTCLLLAGLRAEGPTRVTEPSPSRDHTERMLAAAGVDVLRADGTVTVPGGCFPHARNWEVPGDLSSAVFLIAAALLVPGSDLTITGVGLNPTRLGALEVLRHMGADLAWEIEGGEDVEPFGTIRARHSQLRGIEVPATSVPRLLDEVPVVAVVATQAEGETSFSGISELRVKESDRIETTASGIRALGGEVETGPDHLRIKGGVPLSGGRIDAAGDHRIALSFAIAALVASGDVRISGWNSVETSFPEFLDLLGRAQGRR